MVGSVGIANAVVLNFTKADQDGFIGDAYFSNFESEVSVGSGNIQSFVRWQGDEKTAGFNTDAKIPDKSYDTLETKGGNFTHSIKVGDLEYISLDDGDFYQFWLDINQNNQSNDVGPLLSINDIELYLMDIPDPVDYDTGWGIPVYDMGNGTYEGNRIDIDYSFSSGSGKGFDMQMLLPTSLFGDDMEKYVVLYTSDGIGFPDNDGFQEWKALFGENYIPPPSVPEPATILLFGVGLLGIAGVSRRKK